MLKKVLGICALSLTVLSPVWAAPKTENFHFMPLIYKSLKLNGSQADSITIQEDKTRFVKFTLDGKSYEGQILNFGALVMKQGNRSWVITFDMNAFKRPTFIVPYKTD